MIVAMIGARRHYAVPRLLHEAGCLERFFTDIYIGNKPWLSGALRALPMRARPKVVQRWLGRTDAELPPDKVTSFDAIGLWYSWALSRAKGDADRRNLFEQVAGRFNESILRHGLGSADVVWGFGATGNELLNIAGKMGLRCVMEQMSNPLPIERELTIAEHRRWKRWLPVNQPPSGGFVRDERHAIGWDLADRVIAGSQFVADGLVSQGVDRSKVRVVPYGVDLERFTWIARARVSPGRPLRLLFVGQVSVMKGVPYLLQALKALGPESVEARFVGNVALDSNRLDEFRAVARFLGPIPRSSVLEQYHWADVFCFPSITEGSAAVTYEALATGLPVITTPNAGSIVRDGVDGFIVPIRSPDKLAEALQRYLDDPALLMAHQDQLRNGRERAGLERYKKDLVKVVQDLRC